MTGLYIRRSGLAPQLADAVRTVNQFISSAETECGALSSRLAHYRYLAGLYESAERRWKGIDPETRSLERIELGQKSGDIQQWMNSAARIFVIDYWEALSSLRRAGNQATNAHPIKAAINAAAIRTAIKKIEDQIEAVEELRHAAAHGADWVRERPNKKAITDPQPVMGFDFQGGKLIVGFSLEKHVANASFEGKLQMLPINQSSIDTVLTLKAELFNALVVWPGFTGGRAEPFSFV